MKTYSSLTLAFLLLILVAQGRGDGPTENQNSSSQSSAPRAKATRQEKTSLGITVAPTAIMESPHPNSAISLRVSPLQYLQLLKTDSGELQETNYLQVGSCESSFGWVEKADIARCESRLTILPNRDQQGEKFIIQLTDGGSMQWNPQQAPQGVSPLIFVQKLGAKKKSLINYEVMTFLNGKIFKGTACIQSAKSGKSLARLMIFCPLEDAKAMHQSLSEFIAWMRSGKNGKSDKYCDLWRQFLENYLRAIIGPTCTDYDRNDLIQLQTQFQIGYVPSCRDLSVMSTKGSRLFLEGIDEYKKQLSNVIHGSVITTGSGGAVFIPLPPF